MEVDHTKRLEHGGTNLRLLREWVVKVFTRGDKVLCSGHKEVLTEDTSLF